MKKSHHAILHIQVSLSSKFQLQQTILIFWKKFLKEDTSGETWKNEHHH